MINPATQFAKGQAILIRFLQDVILLRCNQTTNAPDEDETESISWGIKEEITGTYFTTEFSHPDGCVCHYFETEIQGAPQMVRISVDKIELQAIEEPSSSEDSY